MITLRLIANICICVSCGAGFLHGLYKNIGNNSPLFLKAIAGAMGCMMSGRLFSVVLQLCGGKDVTRMNLGYLGVAGCFLFIFSANQGEIRPHVGKVKNIVASFVCLFSFLPILLLVYFIIKSDASIQYKLLGVVVAAAITHTVTHLFMYLIIPDNGDGFIKMLRPYALVTLVFSYSQLGEIYFSIKDNRVMLIITYVVLCISGLVIVPLIERRYMRWEKKEKHNE